MLFIVRLLVIKVSPNSCTPLRTYYFLRILKLGFLTLYKKNKIKNDWFSFGVKQERAYDEKLL